MKIIAEISLDQFTFWSGAKRNVEDWDFTSEQWDRLEETIEELYPDGIEDTQLNGIFWFESDQVEEWAGLWPKYFSVTNYVGHDIVVRCNDEEQESDLRAACKDINVEMYDAEESDFDEISDYDLADYEADYALMSGNDIEEEFYVPVWYAEAYEDANYFDNNPKTDEEVEKFQEFMDKADEADEVAFDPWLCKEPVFTYTDYSEIACNCTEAKFYNS